MKEYLLFRLYGPVASWGDIAVGEYRPSFAHPSKSAILGLVAAALGIRRDEEEPQRELASSYGFGIRVDAMGRLLRDYHTIQVPKGSGFMTRRDELSAPHINTILSSRDYRTDALYTVCLWAAVDCPPHSLDDIKSAVEAPRFTLYLGRKSCPPALPLQPKCVKAPSIREALAKCEFDDRVWLDGILKSTGELQAYWEGEDGGLEPTHSIVRRDAVISRKRWQFSERTELSGVIEGGR